MQKWTSVLLVLISGVAWGMEKDTLPPLKDDRAARNLDEMWQGFDPRAEPLEVETLKTWTQEDVLLRVVRFRIGVFKGRKARLAAIYGVPKKSAGKRIPGLVQIHGGGQFADYRACLVNAKRGYATLSIAWAGRIFAPNYLVRKQEVQLFWDGKKDARGYRQTTDWGAVDGYHAPGRNRGNVFPSARPMPWTLDQVESPRNSGWFLCALAARRALTFLERQPEVDPERLGVYGHSMGGKLTVMAAVDKRVKAAAPSCGGISDRHNRSPLFRATLGDGVSLKRISCPIIFLSPSNDFHGRISDLPTALREVRSQQWRVTCSPHHNHQDTPPYEVATLLWFDQHLKHVFKFPATPATTLQLKTADGVPAITIQPDHAQRILSVDVFYTQHGKTIETPRDMVNSMHRFWHHAKATKVGTRWMAKLPLSTVNKPLWVYANVEYPLNKPVVGAGYYYRIFTAKSFNVSSLLTRVTAKQLIAARLQVSLKPSRLIESFAGDWHKEWFSYRTNTWARTTHKLYDSTWPAPSNAKLVLDVLSERPNKLVMLLDRHGVEIDVRGGKKWQTIQLRPSDFRNVSDKPLSNWKNVKRLTLSPAEFLRPRGREPGKPRRLGKRWLGAEPRFRKLRWVVSEGAR